MMKHIKQIEEIAIKTTLTITIGTMWYSILPHFVLYCIAFET